MGYMLNYNVFSVFYEIEKDLKSLRYKKDGQNLIFSHRNYPCELKITVSKWDISLEAQYNSQFVTTPYYGKYYVEEDTLQVRDSEFADSIRDIMSKFILAHKLGVFDVCFGEGDKK